MVATTTRLFVETLDPRNAPSTLTPGNTASTDWLAAPADTGWLPAYVAPASTPSGITNPGSGSDNQKPVLDEFTLQINPGLVGVFSGRVTDESVSTVTIRFGGTPDCLQEKTTTVAADGTFTFSGQLYAPGDSGTAWAEPVDAQGLKGDYREVVVFLG